MAPGETVNVVERSNASKTIEPRKPDTGPRPAVSIFFSYSRKDKRLRDKLGTFLVGLQHEGLIVGWYDRMIEPGMDWAKEIDEHLKSARLILLLISMDFIASRYCYEIEMLRALQMHEAGEARVIPIILRPSDWQKTPFGYLNALPVGGKPVTGWRDRDEAFLSIALGIRAVVERPRGGSGHAPSSIRLDSAHPANLSRSPVGSTLPEIRPDQILGTDATPILETGTVAIDSPFYVLRRSDELAAEQLDSNNPTVSIKGSRQSGKSSLLARLHHRAIEIGDRSCYLNFQDLDNESLQRSDLLFPEIARMMADELGLSTDPDQFWQREINHRAPKQVLTSFMEKEVLPNKDGGLLLIFDEVDQIFEYKECREEFFSMTRAWHERRQRAARQSPWKRLRLAIAHATDPALWIEDIKQSPFNVGRRLTLEDLDEQQVAKLNELHGRPLSGPNETRRLMDLVGGHPHLLRIAFYTLVAEKWTLDRLEQTACDVESPFAHHLSYYYSILTKTPELRAEVRQILKERSCSDEKRFQNLWAAGLILGKNRDQVDMRCRLYRDYFGKRI
jgi:hypothetical protein